MVLQEKESQSSTVIEVHSFILITPYQWFKESIQLHSWSKYIIRQCLGEKKIFYHLNKRYFINYYLKKTVLLSVSIVHIFVLFFLLCMVTVLPHHHPHHWRQLQEIFINSVIYTAHQYSNLNLLVSFSSLSITFHLVKDLNSIIQFKTRLNISEVRKHLDGLTNLAHTPHY